MYSHRCSVRRRRRALGWLAALGAAGWMTRAEAVNIVLNFESTLSASPSFDPTASGLQSIFEYAEDLWEDIFEDAHTLTINYWYEDLDDGTVASHAKVADNGVRETEANIRVDTVLDGAERDWFIDPTPEDHSEFAMEQTLWLRDLTATQRSNFFNVGAGRVPDTFEAGYTGTALSSGPAAGKWDMVTSVIHEVGHALGLNLVNSAEVADNDFDFDNAFVFGADLAVVGDTLDGAPDNAHLAPQNITLMCGGCAQTDLRRLPSHTDIFAIAAAGQYSDLDVPRREYYGGFGWNTAANWSGNAVPGALDDVYVRNPGPTTVTANLTATALAANLFVSDGGNVDVAGQILAVGESIVVEGLNSDLFVRNLGSISADSLTVRDEGEVRPETGGTIHVGDLTLDDGSVIGAGTLVLDGTLNNSGTISANGGTLTITTGASAGSLDLDGTSGFPLQIEQGVLNAVSGSLVVDGPLKDAFHGTLNVSGAGNAATFVDGWTLGGLTLQSLRSGDLNLENEGAVDGGLLTIHGRVDANAGRGLINAPSDFQPGANVTIAENAELEMNDHAVVAGGTFSIADGALLDFDATVDISNAEFVATGPLADGRLRLEEHTVYLGGIIDATARYWQGGDADVRGATTINGVRVNLDGDGETYWEIDAPLTVNADELDVDNSVFTGTFEINANAGRTGKLAINLSGDQAWTLDGNANISAESTGAGSVVFEGSDFVLSGAATIEGRAISAARVEISGTIFAVAGGGFQLNGGDLIEVNKLAGGQIDAPQLRAADQRALVGFGQIAAAIEFLGASELRADDGELVLQGPINDVGVLGTADPDGILTVAAPWNTNVADRVELRGGVLRGAAVVNDGRLAGWGSVRTASLVNNGLLEADGGTLALETAGLLDLDGAGGGTLRAIDGSLRVDGLAAVVPFQGIAAIGAGQSVVLPNAGLSLQGNGELRFSGGRYRAEVLEQGGRLQTSATPAELDAEVVFAAVGQNRLDADLHLAGDAVVHAGATFQGTANLVTLPGVELHLRDGVDLGSVGLVNQGALALGSSPGEAAVGRFRQSHEGSWLVEIGGTAPGTEFDRLVVDATAELGGTLIVLLADLGSGLFQPASGDRFEIVSAGGVTGQFGQVALPVLSAGLLWHVDVGSDVFALQVFDELAGDFDGDGNVDGLDLLAWQRGASPVAYSAEDLTAWEATFGASASGAVATVASIAAVAAVPEPSSTAWCAALACMCLLVRKRGLGSDR